MRWLGWVIATVLLIAVGIAAAVTTLLATDRGTVWSAEQIMARVPGLSLERVSGNLLEGVHIERVSYSGEPAIEAHTVVVAVELWPLLNLEALNITHLAIDSLQVQVDASGACDASPETNTLETTELSLPGLAIDVEVRNAEIRQLVYGDTVLNDTKLVADWRENNLDIGFLATNFDDLAVEASGRIVSPLQLNLQLAWHLDTLGGQVLAEGTLDNLQIEHVLELDEFAPIRTRGMVALDNLDPLRATLHHTVVEPDLAFDTAITVGRDDYQIEVAGQALGYKIATRLLGTLETPLRMTLENGRLAQVVGFDGVLDLTGAPSLDINFASNALEALDNRVAGDAEGRLVWRNDALRMEARSTRLESSGVTALDTRISIDGPPASLRYAVNTRQISGYDLQLTEFNVRASGPSNDLQFAADWHSGNISGRLHVGEQDLRIQVDAGARLELAKHKLTNAAAFTIQRNRGLWSATSHCWQGIGEICIQSSEFDTSGSRLQGRLRDVELSAMNRVLPIAFDAESRVDGQWSWHGSRADWQAELLLATRNLVFSDGERTFDWLPDVTLSAALSPTGATIDGAGRNDGIQWRGSIVTDGLNTAANLEGKLQVEAKAQALKTGLAALQRFEGAIEADLNIAGTVAAPTFAAEGSWQSGGIHWLEPEIDLADVNLRWFASNDAWRFDGTAQPRQGGVLTVTGKGDGYDRSANVDAHVSSTGVSLTSDFWTVTAIPEAQFAIRDGRVQYQGQAAIPEAKVELKTLPTTLPRPVGDVQVRGRPAPPETEASLATGKVVVTLGDNVHLDLLALAVRLEGTLTADMEGTEVSSLHGELSIRDGSLDASGQSLRVKEGRVLFSGNPTLPYIDLVAVRDIDDHSSPLQVGLRVHGRSDALKTTVYSNPAMNETRALSFLVLGRDFNASSDSDNNQLLSAAIGLGLSQTQGVVQNLRNAIGLDELSALAAKQNDVAIVAGKKISDDLYVRYSYNALSAVGSLIIRYHLTNRWRLEASNDVNSSMDLLYEFKR